MKKYRIKYKKGDNIYIKNIQANNHEEAVHIFYMDDRNADILEIKDVKDLGAN